MIKIGLAAVMLAVLVFGYLEIKSWSTHPDLISPKQRRIRTLGFVFLLVSLGLWLNGTYIKPPGHLKKPLTHEARLAAVHWIGYWGITFLTLVPIIPLALLDARENLRRASAQRRSILQEALSPSDKGSSAESPSQTVLTIRPAPSTQSHR
jgi:hypothetical protein